MLVYNCQGNDAGGNTCSKSEFTEGKQTRNGKKSNKKKTVKKGYKSAAKRKPHCYSRKSVGAKGVKRSKVQRKKKISKKNTRFLEGIGLKVKKSR